MTSPTPSARRHTATLLITTLALAASVALPAVADPGDLQLLTGGSDSIYGGEAWGISADGRYVLTWTPMDWSPQEVGDGDAEDMYVWDRVDARWIWASPPVTSTDDPGALIPGGVMSADGSTVAYAEQQPDGAFALTVTDLPAGVARRHGTIQGEFPTVSGDGRLVGHGLVTDPADPGTTYAAVLDRTTGVTTVHGPAGSRVSDISDDGTTMTYQVATSQFFHDWFVVDLRTGEQQPVTPPTAAGLRDTSGVLTADGSIGYYVGVDDSGRIIVRHDVTTDTSTTVLSGLDNPRVTDVTPTGERVHFTDGTALVEDDTNDSTDAYVLDVATGTVVRASTGTGGRQSAQGIESLGTFIAADGVTTTFTSSARDLVDGDLPPFFNAYLKTIDGLAPLPGTPIPSVPPTPRLDGDPSTTELLPAASPTDAAVSLSRGRFGRAQAPYAVLARDDAFADALAGTALSAGPLLLTDGADLTDVTATELRRVLAPGGLVQLLGGSQAISDRVAAQLGNAGFDVRRLAGPTRVETALAIADVVAPGTVQAVGLARSDSPADNPTAAWADSLAGGVVAAATGQPLLLNPTAGLHPAVAAWLADHGVQRTTLYGGDEALSPSVAADVPDPVRLGGATRAGTAVAVADSPIFAGARGSYLVVDGYSADGWAYGLPAAVYAATTAAAGSPVPLLLVGQDVPPETAAVVAACGEPTSDLLVIGSGGAVPAAVVDELVRLDGQDCG